MKRMLPRARGGTHRLLKRTCHITVKLDELPDDGLVGRVDADVSPKRRTVKAGAAKRGVTKKAPIKKSKQAPKQASNKTAKTANAKTNTDTKSRKSTDTQSKPAATSKAGEGAKTATKTAKVATNKGDSNGPKG
jgi:hypothetical protein